LAKLREGQKKKKYWKGRKEKQTMSCRAQTKSGKRKPKALGRLPQGLVTKDWGGRINGRGKRWQEEKRRSFRKEKGNNPQN